MRCNTRIRIDAYLLITDDHSLGSGKLGKRYDCQLFDVVRVKLNIDT
jgi:hypothetical protein